MSVKFSQFVSGGLLRNTDIVVGLRASDNTQFDSLIGIGDAQGQPILTWSAGATPNVNYVNFQNNVTGSAPIIGALGSDVNIGLTIQAKGTGVITVAGNSAINVPHGTTAQRPAGAAGELRLNTTTGLLEFWNPLTAAWEDSNSSALAALTYVTNTDQTALLANSQPLSALSTGIMKVTTATGIVSSLAIPLTVANGGTGDSTITAHGIIIGQGTSALSAITLSSGQILIGSTGVDPVAAAINSGSGILVANGAGSITVSNLGVLSNVATANQTTVSGATGNVTIGIASNAILPGSGGVTLPNGNTAARAGGAFTIRGNSQTSVFEGTVDGATWLAFSNSSGTVTSVSGTANQINSTGGNTPVLSLSSTAVFPGTVTLNADPVTNLQAATKQYVDSIASGLIIKTACYAATTANLTATFNNLGGIGDTLTNSGAMAAFATDGTSPPINSRILVKNQSTTYQNGIYTLTTVGSGAANWVLTRATDFDTAAEIMPGDFILINNGTLYASTGWIQTATVVTIDVDPILFSQFGASNVVSVSGTANRITTTGTTSVTIDISNAYVGQATITTLGTITTGVWHGTAIAEIYGGTNQTTYTLGDTLYASGANTLAKLAGNITTAKQYLSQTGNGAVSAAPAWATIAGSDITGAALTKTDDTNVTLTLGGTPTTALLRAASLTLGWTGTLGVARGGTAAASFTAYSVLCAGTTSTGAFQNVSGVGSAGQGLVSNGAGALPSWQDITTASSTVERNVTQSSHGFSVGNVVYLSSGTYTLAKADAAATAEVVGIVSVVIDANNFTLVTGGYISTLSGLTAGTVYFLSDSSAGAYSATEPSTIGNISKPLLIAASSTTAYFNNMRGKVIPSPATVDQTTTSVTMVAGTIYLADNASLVTFTVPASVTQFSTFEIIGQGAGGWKLQFNTGQVGNLNSTPTTSAGSFASTNRYNCIKIVCTVANTTFTVTTNEGSITVA